MDRRGRNRRSSSKKRQGRAWGSASIYGALFEQSPEPMWAFDSRTLRFLAVNDVALARYEYTRPEFLSLSVVDLRAPEGSDTSGPRVADSQRTGAQPVVRRLVTRTGTVVEAIVYTTTVTLAHRRVRLELAVEPLTRVDSPAGPAADSVQGPKLPARDPYETLSGREREVLNLAAKGLTNHEIAIALAIGRRTAETHRSNLMRKLSLRGEKDLIRYAIRLGIIPLNPGK